MVAINKLPKVTANNLPKMTANTPLRADRLRRVAAAREERELTRVGNQLSSLSGTGFTSRLGGTAKVAGRNFKDSFGGASMLKGLGAHALRGGVAGGLAGGTMEAAQGGSFWTGAKSGAWNGALGWTAYRSLGRATQSSSRGPFSKDGPIQGMSAMFGASSADPKVSKQAVALLNQRQRNNLTRNTMNR